MTYYTLVGVDGNAFAVMGYVTGALRREGFKDKIEEYRKEAMSGNYDNLLAVSMRYLDELNEATGAEEEF